ncbi:MAG TPA: DUF2272 domain-containing protein [Longimicrobium sp.]|jgi:hypothetical protein|nr:DUF2272 domain-containing protein [Longimicrobium sp.]
MATKFATDLVALTQTEHDKFHLEDEHDPKLSAEIKRFWTELGFLFPGVSTPWSAVFVSDCMKRAGAASGEFHFAAAHSEFVFKAIENEKAGTGVFRAVPIDKHAPQPGDVIQNNRGGQTITYDFAAKHPAYTSHSAIVVDVGEDTDGRFAHTVGGNEANSIRMKRVRLDSGGLIIQRTPDPFICVIKNLK